jgi:acylphosphatase
MIRQRFFFSGRVQGVGFRYTAESIARGFPVAGWVRNLADGRVEMLLEGEAEALQAVVATLQERMGSNITGTLIHDEPPTGEFSAFRIAP